MDVLEAIRTRRAIRHYTKEPVPPELIEKLLEAGRWAPSSVNSQPWEFIVITDPDIKKRISRSFNFGPFLNEAPLAIAVVVDRLRTALPAQDGAIAAYAIWLAAHDLGSGSLLDKPEHPRWHQENSRYSVHEKTDYDSGRRLSGRNAGAYP